MSTDDVKRIVIVLSPGRSGTSLLMNILGSMGMNLSKEMIPGNLSNPEGFFEDIEIVNVHKELLKELHTKPTLPLPEGWLESKAAHKARIKLKEVLERRIEESPGRCWGFKDPRTVSFLPLWSRILNAPGIVPVFIVSVRNPATVAMSLKRQINREEVITELQWLQRMSDALYYTAADCFILHYEDWFVRPSEIARELIQYTGIKLEPPEDVIKIPQRIIKPNLNRAIYDDYTLQNQYVHKLYTALKNCRGSDFDRTMLMGVVKDCRRTMVGFRGWYQEIHAYIKKEDHYKERLKKKEEILRKNRKQQDDLRLKVKKVSLFSEPTISKTRKLWTNFKSRVVKK